jgi:hypothetical protein
MECRAGLDWGTTTHALCVVDDAGGVVVRLEVPHSAAGLAELIRRLARPAPTSGIPITVERPSGLLVDTLLAAGKSDPSDAYVLADILRTDILRTDGHRFPPLRPCSDELEELRALARGRDDLVAEHAVAALADGRPVKSFLRAGRVCAAQILAGPGDVRERFPTEDQLAAEAGVCPVTHACGKSRGVVFRRACNHRRRQAVTCFADNSRRACTWAAQIYQRARARRCDHLHAVRILARTWIRVLWRAWHDRTAHDPSKHRAAQNLAPAA